ncbi:MAG: hypothetical protein RL709_663 [Pseudomonadota bacterium]|jgi:hypothetical protein
MYSAEQIFQELSYNDLWNTLKSIVDEDNYLVDYLVSDLAGDFIYMLEVYNLVWIASDDRILLTGKGEKVLQNLIIPVELTKKSSKFKY